MIKSFADRDTKRLFSDGISGKIPPDVRKRAIRKLDMVDSVVCIDDLKVPPGNRMHQLQGTRAGQYAISVNDLWRICFRFEDSDAYDVEFCDYH